MLWSLEEVSPQHINCHQGRLVQKHRFDDADKNMNIQRHWGVFWVTILNPIFKNMFSQLVGGFNPFEKY